MPIPVAITATPLAVDSGQNAKVELFIAKMTQLFGYGTSGLTVSGKPAAAAITIPDGDNPSVLTPLLLSTEKDQAFYRLMGFALLTSGIMTPVAGVGEQKSGSTSDPNTSSNSFAVLAEMTSTLTYSGGSIMVNFSTNISLSTNTTGELAIYLDTVQVTGTLRSFSIAPSGVSEKVVVASHALLTGVAAGAHTIDVRWRLVAGVGITATTTNRSLVVKEIF